MNDPLGEDSTDEKTNVPALPGQVGKYVQSFQSYAERVGERFDTYANYIVPRNEDDNQAPENLARGPILFGMVMLILFFGVFGLWSIIAPIDSAAIAPGKVVLDSNKKTIDHLEGGIVEEILVREGDIVEAGQPLVRLDDTAAQARLDLLKGQYVSALATQARLTAERDGKEEVEFPAELLEQEDADPKVADSLDSQRRLFDSRRESVKGRMEVLQQQIKQSEEEINGLGEQIKSSNTQMALLSDEIKDVKFLLKTGDAAKTRLLALERRFAEIKGEKGERQALIARAEQSINEAKIEMFNLQTDRLNEVVDQLKETQDSLSELQERLRAAEDVVERIVIRAPIGGEITGLSVHTVGGVVAPGAPIMDIVPSDDELIVEARVSPQDIDVVRPGLTAQVRLLAYRVRHVPPIDGEVVVISADRFENERTGEAYFNARIKVSQSQLDEYEEVKLSPGMPAEVLIVTGSRSLFAYLMDPISASFNRAFREQ